MATLTVDIGEDSVHEIGVPRSFEATAAFDIEFRNHGRATHVHLNVDDSLSRLVSVKTGNFYIPENGVERLFVDVIPLENSTSGHLKIAVGHGSKVAHVVVTVDQKVEDNSVTVDETLAEPPTTESRADRRRRLYERVEARLTSLVTGGIIILAVAVAVGIGVTIGDPVVSSGVVVVAGAAILAVLLLFGWTPGE
ncbi:MAG: hypothetical protein A07HR60_00770 [uncultured archaeon A07HR60]|nr:MAG: hypothetical protein A07HR60_00770 [uncultured archaeon A07HR60]